MKVHGKDTISKGGPIEERKRNSIAGLQAVFLFCIALYSVILAPLVSADREPNDHIEDAEIMGSSTKGIVDMEPISDVDTYRIKVPSDRPCVLKLTLLENGFLTLYTTTDPNGTGMMLGLSVDSFSPSGKVKFTESEHKGVVFCTVIGKGNYLLEANVPKNTIDVKGPSKELIIFVSLGAFLLVFLLLVSALFIKMVNMRKEDRMDRALKTEIPYEEAMERRCFRSDFNLNPSPYTNRVFPDTKTEEVCYDLPQGVNGRNLIVPVEQWSEEFEEDPY